MTNANQTSYFSITDVVDKVSKEVPVFVDVGICHKRDHTSVSFLFHHKGTLMGISCAIYNDDPTDITIRKVDQVIKVINETLNR